MGRPNRIQFAGACYHIMLQGNNRQDIFMGNQDRRYFLSLLKGYKDRYDLKVYAYALMNNYVHLLIETGQPNLSKVMQGFNTAYTKYFNQKHNTIGHVFQGRYKALIVDTENYLLELTRYIHLAPMRDGMKERPWRYQWSSCPAYVESENREPLVDSDLALKSFSGSRLKKSVRYMQFIKERSRQADIEPPKVRGLYIGSDDFIQNIQQLFGGLSKDEGGSDGVSADVIMAEVQAKHGVDQEKLFGRSQWREISTVRKEAIYRLWKEAQMGVTEISRMFNRTPSAVSQLIRSIETSGVSKN
ncbi:MAG: transposase [Elusimicrobiota bacterium]